MAIALYAPALSILAEDEDHWTEKHQSQTEIEHLKILTHKNKLSEISGSEKKWPVAVNEMKCAMCVCVYV